MNVTVTDTGLGIAEADIPKALSVFGQVHRSKSHEGTGLGLSIVKSLVGLHAGEISVQSRVNEGTTVTVALPLAFTPPTQQPSSNIATLTPALRSGPPNQPYQVKKSA